jgi:hypothetical protein
MPISKMLQLKISATKKRLFKGFIPQQALSVLALSGLVCVSASMVRVISAGTSFTVVPLDVPVLPAPILDKTLAGFRETAKKSIGKSTLTVALTPKEFIFGDMSAFTTNVNDAHDKFVVSHVDGSPQVNTLLSQVAQWRDDRFRRLSVRPDRQLILVPDSRVPMNIVIQVSKLLRESKQFDSVFLAGGVL